MAKSQDSFNKQEKEKKRLKKKQEKQQRREERNANSQGGGLENMMAYVDEDGNITDTPPDPAKKKDISAESIEIGIPKKEEVEVDAVRKGRVDFFNTSKGFGFIRELETQEKFFVHVSALTEEIAENDTVTFEVERGLKGMNAINVKKA
ncbi:cold shock domain-containing protein [Fulvivirgaceae bacterium BMA12]|uniref:Cold shock domain-containing protein n=1 Tax=Agaribacillus aureus TaxID=3051825 RepID=A0ABT8LD48_9BACT|nr:cold shock domain-containing protein [Fulvivirgaceae bacterium BMA12]